MADRIKKRSFLFIFFKLIAIRYLQLELIGKGGSSQVYKVLGPDLKVYALKKVCFGGVEADSTTVESCITICPVTQIH